MTEVVGPIGRVVRLRDGRLTAGKMANAKFILNRVTGELADEKVVAAAKRAWIVAHAGPDNDLRRNLLIRRRAVVAALARQGVAAAEVRLRVVTPLAVGHSGAGSPNDNSLTLHGISGDPVIPATALKGVARSMGPVDDELFGTAGQDDGSGSIGAVTFLPAFPEGDLTLRSAVLTPHAGDYYSSNGSKPASGHQSPVPVEFVTVRKGVFVGHILGPEKAVAEARRLLIEAVDELGVGAKTATGYGYMREALS